MAEAKHGRRTPRVVLMAVSLGAALVIAVSLVIAGASGSGHPQTSRFDSQTDSLDTHRGAPASRETTSNTTTATAQAPSGCNVLQQILTACAAPTTTTAPPPTTRGRPGPVPPAPAGDQHTASSTDSGACGGSSPPVAPPVGTWTCTLDDEFNSTSPNSSLWQPVQTSTSGYQNGPLLSPVCYIDNPNTISESGGTLNLSVVQVPSDTSCRQPGGSSFSASYEGGMIASYQLFSQRYGYFAVRAAMPAASVPGLQETLWLYPENETLYGPWPDSGEIDYGEFYSSYPQDDVPALHYPGSSDDPNATSLEGCRIPGAATAGQFHTYALAWTPTTITTYFDGVPCTSDTYAPYVTNPDAAPAPFDQPFFLAFTAALGSYGNDVFQPGTTPLPATTKIDWVRVWQY